MDSHVEVKYSLIALWEGGRGALFWDISQFCVLKEFFFNTMNNCSTLIYLLWYYAYSTAAIHGIFDGNSEKVRMCRVISVIRSM